MKAVNQADFEAGRVQVSRATFPFYQENSMAFGGKRKRHSPILNLISVGPTA